MNIQRYKRHNGLTKDDSGEYVRWEDHCAEVEQLKYEITQHTGVAAANIDRAEAAEAEVERLEKVCGLHWQTIQDANKRAEAAESENKELRAKLKAVEGLPEKWRKERDLLLHGTNGGESQCWDDAVTMCADELESRLKGEQP